MAGSCSADRCCRWQTGAVVLLLASDARMGQKKEVLGTDGFAIASPVTALRSGAGTVRSDHRTLRLGDRTGCPAQGEWPWG